MDFVTRKVVLLAHNFLKFDSCITKVLRSRLFRYQAFTALPTEIWSINEYVSNCKQNEVVSESHLSCILNAMLFDIMSTISMADGMLQILHMMLESIRLSVSCKSALPSFVDSDHGENLESLRELLLNDIERSRDEYMQSNDESFVKDMYEKESERSPSRCIFECLWCNCSNYSQVLPLTNVSSNSKEVTS